MTESCSHEDAVENWPGHPPGGNPGNCWLLLVRFEQCAGLRIRLLRLRLLQPLVLASLLVPAPVLASAGLPTADLSTAAAGKSHCPAAHPESGHATGGAPGRAQYSSGGAAFHTTYNAAGDASQYAADDPAILWTTTHHEPTCATPHAAPDAASLITGKTDHRHV